MKASVLAREELHTRYMCPEVEGGYVLDTPKWPLLRNQNGHGKDED
nr:hypothetical protein Iba_chr07cCG5890 [Ipomoea batatas]GMD45695.1 hypothetical protein Iba_chr10dCG12570 [Ipomoea batatas]